METIKVLIGRVVSGNNIHQDDTRQVEFTGEEMAQIVTYGKDRNGGGITDTRGTTETLYKTDDDRLIVHVNHWSRWQGEPDVYLLLPVTEDDLKPTGKFERLGKEAGYSRPLTLDEAILAVLDEMTSANSAG